jgi:hypothetical protein
MKRHRPAPARALVPLTIAVLLAHVWLLQEGPDRMLRPGKEASRTFSTRLLAPAAPQPPAAEARAAPAAPRPPRSRSTAPPQATPAAPPVAASPQPGDTPPAPAPPRPLSDLDSGSPLATARGPMGPPPEAATPPAASPPSGDVSALPQVLSIPVPARLRYDVVAQVKGVPVLGHASIDWRHDGSKYEARWDLSVPFFPSRVQRSEGRITEDGLAPRYFSDRNRGEQATHFDHDKGTVIFSNNQPQAALARGMQDRLSVVLQLSVLVAGEPSRFTPGVKLAIPTAGTREAETWIFEVGGEEDLQLPGGAMRALKLVRSPRKEFDTKVELWLAPRLDYAPVRLRLTNSNGDTVDQRWASTDKG